MLYYLSEQFNLFGTTIARLMDYLTVRSAIALLLSLFIALAFGERIIALLQKRQVGEIVRNLGIEGQMKKTGTPTMGASSSSWPSSCRRSSSATSRTSTCS